MGELETLRICVLGGFRVLIGSRVVEEDAWRLRKARSIVKLLALARGHRLHREQVMDTLWPNLEPEAAANNLRYALHVARRVLQSALGAMSGHKFLQGDPLILHPSGPVWTDIQAFEVAAAAAQRARAPQAYRAAIELYGGELLPEDRYEDWAIGHRERLHERFINLLVGLARLYEDRGELPAAIEALQRAVAREPVHEEANVGLMRLYAVTGQRHRALRQYQGFKEAFARKLDAEPEVATQHLYREILTGRAPAVVASLSPARRPLVSARETLAATPPDATWG